MFSVHAVAELDVALVILWFLSTDSLDKSPENFPRMGGKLRRTSLSLALLDNRSARVGTTPRSETKLNRASLLTAARRWSLAHLPAPL